MTLKGIRTIDDLLSNDDVNHIMQTLAKLKPRLAGMVAITIQQDGTLQVWSSLDIDGTLATLSRATYVENEVAGHLELYNDD